MDEITIKLPNGETLAMSRDDSRSIARRLWDLGSYPGAAPMAVKLSEAVAASAIFLRPVAVTEREYGALSHALSNEEVDTPSSPRERRSTSVKEVESREPEGPQDSSGD